MTELVPIRRGQDLQAAGPIPDALPIPAGVSTLRAWATSLQDAVALADALVDTPFVPDSYRPEVPPRATAEDQARAREIAVATAAAAIMTGSEVGFTPMAALQNVNVIKGRPSFYAAAMVALLQAAGHQVWTEDSTATRAVVCGRRRGSEFVERVEVTIDQARRAGWTRNQKYSTEPEAMLWARAASKVCRRVAQDVLKGLACVEDMQDGDDQAPASATQTVSRTPVGELEQAPAVEQPKPARAPRKKAAAAKPTGDAGPPPLPGEDEPAAAAAPAAEAAGPPPLPGEDRASGEQLQAIGAGFTQLGITGADRRAYVNAVLGREVADPTELTTAEAAAVLDELLGPPPDDDDSQTALDVDDPDDPS